MTDKQALRMRNYLDTALKSGVKLLHLSTDELKDLLDELEADKEQIKTLESRNRRLNGIIEAAEKRIAETNLRNTELAAKIEPIDRQVDELTMWVKRLAHSLRNTKPDSKLHSDAMDYLSRKGLISVEDVLR